MITGGQIMATGDMCGAGIGGGDSGAVGNVEVRGGTVVAKAGSMGVYDIGAGWGGEDVGDFIVTGGSVHLANSGLCRKGYPQNAAGAQAYCVTVPGLTADSAVTLEGDFPDYGAGDIFADQDGKIYLYLPNGTYSFTANDVSYSVTVADGPTTATAE